MARYFPRSTGDWTVLFPEHPKNKKPIKNNVNMEMQSSVACRRSIDALLLHIGNPNGKINIVAAPAAFGRGRQNPKLQPRIFPLHAQP
jgi:hypothetical protein